MEVCSFKPDLSWGANCFKSCGSFETAGAGYGMVDAVTDEGGIACNGRGFSVILHTCQISLPHCLLPKLFNKCT